MPEGWDISDVRQFQTSLEWEIPRLKYGKKMRFKVEFRKLVNVIYQGFFGGLGYRRTEWIPASPVAEH